MKSLVVILLIAFGACEKRDTNFEQEYSDTVHPAACVADEHAVQAFRLAYDGFSIKLFQKSGIRSQYFLVISPHAIWTTLAAIAEGADQLTQKELFEFLGLPNDACTREKFYKIVTSRIFPITNYVSVDNRRTLIINNNAQVNPKWKYLIQKHSLLDVIYAPIKSDPATASEIIKQIVSSDAHKLDLSGNSVLLNSIDFNGLWTTAFADAVVKRSPFYSPTGQRIGSVDLMRVKRRLRIGYIPTQNAKVIELPIGINEEYSMVFGMVVGDNPSVEPAITNSKNYTIFEALSSLKDSIEPIDVAIPRFLINSEINVRDILEDFGIVNMWKSPEATRFISIPPAQPSSYIQRMTVTMNNGGILPAPQRYPAGKSIGDEYWREFVADRPFMFGLFDKETFTCILGTLYTQPTYPD